MLPRMSEKEKRAIKRMLNEELSITEISQKVKRPYKSIYQFCADYKKSDEYRKIVEYKKEAQEKAEKENVDRTLEMLQQISNLASKRAIENLEAGENLRLGELMTALGVSVDKSQLLSGKATERQDVTINVTIDD